MPMGKGTYGSQKGRPKKREKMYGGSMMNRKKMMDGGVMDFNSVYDLEKPPENTMTINGK
tara:strand:- start:348 stop:527 length:180 start_codon:yes stop_codon:yes gene_type:complete